MAVADTSRLVGEEITMSLMKRARDSVFALPKEEWVEHASVPNLTAGEHPKCYFSIQTALQSYSAMKFLFCTFVDTFTHNKTLQL